MIIEELQQEIDSRTNKLVIEYLADLFVRGINVNDFDPEMRNLLAEYITTIYSYVDIKKSVNRLKKKTCDYHGSLSHFEVSDLNALDTYQERFYYINKTKKELRQKLIENNIEYKKYHPCQI